MRNEMRCKFCKHWSFDQVIGSALFGYCEKMKPEEPIPLAENIITKMEKRPCEQASNFLTGEQYGCVHFEMHPDKEDDYALGLCLEDVQIEEQKGEPDEDIPEDEFIRYIRGYSVI
ncbi:MAG: hypothetical protein NW226_17655 [Microscillaceae bacterium]|nr:hypothetical protein [Microscillaceae bacterium]